MRKIMLIVIPILFIGIKCINEEDCHKKVLFINNSDNSVYVIASHSYPDTLVIRHGASPVKEAYQTKILANSSSDKPLWRRDCIELAYKDLIPSDTMMVYVFDADVVESLPWETVIVNRMILKRYDLSLQDLRNMNWTITYP